MKNADRNQIKSNIRVSNKTDVIFPILKEQYHNELSLTLSNDKLYLSYLSESISDNLWKLVDSDGLNITYNDKLNICIPFDDIDVQPGEHLDFFFVVANSGVRNAFMPKDVFISVMRP